VTLTLVKSDNVVQIYETCDIATMAREFADDIEAGHFPGATRVLALVQRDGGMTIVSFGEPVEAYEIIGLFEAAKFHAMADMIVPDEE
jgi:hypothetical protein